MSFVTIIGQKAANFGHAVGNGFKAVGNGFANFGLAAVTPSAAKAAEAALRNGIDSAYNKIGQGFNRAVEVMEREASTTGQATGGIEAIRAPIASMQNYTIKPLVINEDDSDGSKAIKGLANGIKTYHKNVIQKGEAFSRAVGDKTHALTRFILTPIRFIFKFLQIEAAGAIIQNSVALAVAFAVRGIVLGLSQLGHLVPYIVAAALVGGAVYGMIHLAAVSPLAALGVGVAVIVLGQQLQINKLAKKVVELTQGFRAYVNDTVASRAINFGKKVVAAISNKMPKGKTVVKAATVGAGLTLAAGALYMFGGRAASFVSGLIPSAGVVSNPELAIPQAVCGLGDKAVLTNTSSLVCRLGEMCLNNLNPFARVA